MKRRTSRTLDSRALVAAAALALAAPLLAGCATKAAEAEYYASLAIEDPDLGSAADGSYKGSHALRPPFGVYVANPRVDALVRIADHRYADIAITTRSAAPMPSLAKLRRLILERQTLQVDALSGATSLTGKAYLKAVESALAKDR
jgi:uncharacterized protein with FMN-binding domain